MRGDEDPPPLWRAGVGGYGDWGTTFEIVEKPMSGARQFFFEELN
jgi:hypothetical protein